MNTLYKTIATALITLLLTACGSTNETPKTKTQESKTTLTGTVTYSFEGVQHTYNTYSKTSETRGTVSGASVKDTNNEIRVSIHAEKELNDGTNNINLNFKFPNATVTTGSYHTDTTVIFVIEGKVYQSVPGYDTVLTTANDDGTIIELKGTTTAIYSEILSNGKRQEHPLILKIDVKASR